MTIRTASIPQGRDYDSEFSFYEDYWGKEIYIMTKEDLRLLWQEADSHGETEPGELDAYLVANVKKDL